MTADTKSTAFGLSSSNGLVDAFQNAYNYFSERREALGLSNPGTVENIAREVQRDVFLNSSMFTGLRADLSKTFSAQPMFQVSHGFALGSQGLPPYTFLTTYGTPRVLMHGSIDNEGQFAGRYNYRWADPLVTKFSAQVTPEGQAMLSVDNEYTGKDFCASLKTINPNALDGGLTGIFIGSYLQSVTPSLALGLEAFWQRQALTMGPDVAVSYVAKYRGRDWVASAQLQPQGAINTSYWRRLTEKVEVGADLTLQFQPGFGGSGLLGSGLRKEGSATLGAKYDFRTSTLRAQADSSGKISALFEKRVHQFVQITFAGELDHVKQSAKVGLAVSVESPSEEIMQEQERMVMSGMAPQAPPQAPPF